MKRLIVVCALAAIVPTGVRADGNKAECRTKPVSPASTIEFPSPAPETRPWGICHALGSAIETDELAKEMARWREGGLGGVRLVPIYGAKGYEDKYVPFMSPKFIDILRDFNSLSRENEMKFDLSFGAGWCFGGRTIPPELGVQALKVLREGDELPPHGKILWEGKDRRLVAYPTGQTVKRAQKADSGPMLNPFSPAAFKAHLGAFKPLDACPEAFPRATFHDSFEYIWAGWSDELPGLFLKYRGYPLEEHYAELAGVGIPDAVARVKCDYRETLSDILTKETFPIWTRWCRERGILTHNQAHGAPANLLEFYAVSDTPETEMFGRGDRDKFKSCFDENFRDGTRNILVSKFASSAAHLAGRKYVSAEAFTWMAEHFCETLEEMKAFGDLLFLSGVNRLYFHATVYSPDSAPWPGWCFYAASEINPRNPIWRDIRPLNDYFTRVQSLLAEAKSANDILLYWPVYDLWMSPRGFAPDFSVNSKRWLDSTPFGNLARRLADAGYSFDYVSDSFLTDKILSRYKAIVVPEAKYMKPQTLARLAKIAVKIPVIFEKSIPEAAPGISVGSRNSSSQVPFAPVSDAIAALGKTEAKRDAFAASSTPFDCIRLQWRGRTLYFIVNSSMSEAALALPNGAVAMNPMDGECKAAATYPLSPAQSCFVYLPLGGEISVCKVSPLDDVHAITGNWRLEFVDDVSNWPLPASREGDVLGDWTRFGDKETRFSGSALYSLRFVLDDAVARRFSPGAVLDLGEVSNSAKVSVNGYKIGTAFMHPYRLSIPPGILRSGTNLLEVRVTNLGANRIRAYDRKRIVWKIFDDANVSTYCNSRQLLNASGWPLLPSGLIGPVKLVKQTSARKGENE